MKGNFVFTKVLVGRVVGKYYARQPVNLGTWEPDGIGYISLQYGAKAVSEVNMVKVPPPLQIQHNLYEELVSIRIKYKIL